MVTAVFSWGEAPYDMPLDEFQSHASYGTINSLLKREHGANSNVGLYLSEEGLPVRLNKDTDPNPNAPFIIDERNEVMESFSTMPGYEMRASKMYKLVHSFSDRSVVYVTRNRPSNPASHSHGPQTYIGVHGYGGSDKTAYNSMARDLDNYIYNNRTIEIVAAGNNPKKMSAKGYAVNAITVGALDPLTGKEASYSGKSGKIIDPIYSEEYAKPDIYNYSNFYIDDFYRVYSSSSRKYEYKPFYEGTEAATGVTAGMISDMLSKNEFYKWHPEVVKAVMLNIKDAEMFNYEGLVGKRQSSQKDREYQHLSMYFVGDVNTLMKEAECEGRLDYCYSFISFEEKKQLTIKLSKSHLERFFDVEESRLDGFRIAISWLNSGNDIANLGDVPQKYRIYVYTRDVDNSNFILRNWSDGASRGDHSGYPSYPYNQLYDAGYSPRHSHFNNLSEFKIQIVLDEENPNSEKYGQMALGVDIMPIIY